MVAMAVLDGCNGTIIACTDTYECTMSNMPVLAAELVVGCENGLIIGETYYLTTGIPLNGEGYIYTGIKQKDVGGCIDPSALNYNACANVHTIQCIYEDACPADFDDSGSVNISDLLYFISLYGSTCNTSETNN